MIKRDELGCTPCFLCRTLTYHGACIVCGQPVCSTHIAQDILPGDYIICVRCDPLTPNREQAIKHYLLRKDL